MVITGAGLSEYNDDVREHLYVQVHDVSITINHACALLDRLEKLFTKKVDIIYRYSCFQCIYAV